MSKDKKNQNQQDPKPKYDITTLMHMGFPFIPVEPKPEVKTEEKPKSK